VLPSNHFPWLLHPFQHLLLLNAAAVLLLLLL
jgi:hypothetical protein